MRIVILGERANWAVAAGAKTLMTADRLEGHKVWVKAGGLSFIPTRYNLDVIREAFPNVEVEDLTKKSAVAQEFEEHATKATRVPYQTKTKPLDHQAKGMEKYRTKTHFALFMDPGTGKTKMGIDRFGELFCEGVVTGLIIFAPKGVHAQWVNSQMPIHFGLPFVSFAWPIKRWTEEMGPSEVPKVLTLNWDAIKTDKGRALIKQFIAAHDGKVMCVADESHNIKNEASERAKAAREHGKACAVRMLMTGTPIAKDLSDEWAQFLFLDPTIFGMVFRKTFQNEYCIMGGFEGSQVIAHKNLERFREITDPYTYRVTKEDIGLLPPVRTPWVFDLSPKQKAMIKDIKVDLIARIDSREIVDVANGAVAALKIQQVSNGFIKNEDGKTTILFPHHLNPRLEALKEIAETRLGKIIIWCRFRDDIEMVIEALGAKNCVRYVGGMDDKTQRSAIDSFLHQDGARFFVSTSAGGTGLNLQGLCQVDIFFSNSDNAIDRWQMESRADRIGSAGVVEHIDLIGRGGQDLKIIGRHKRKQLISEMGIGEFRKWLEDDDYEAATLEDVARGTNDDGGLAAQIWEG